MAALKLPRAGRREPEPWGHVAALELPQAGRRELGTRDSPSAAPSWEAGTGASGHAGTCARLVFCLDLELVRGGTRSLGYRHKLVRMNSLYLYKDNPL
jgi:hypothetical protein